MKFTDLGLSDKVLSAVTRAGYENPTPIQEQAIPPVLRGRDVLGIAQTGTGKTASFVLPILTRLERGRARARMPRSLVLEPTRELAAQVVEELEVLGSEHKLTVALLIGGVSFDEQERKLDRGADVLIATPGRLLDHFGRGKLLLTGVEILVIDEADRMLDMGFIPDIERITKLIPPPRQTLLFSATMPKEIQRLADKFMTSPERIEASPPSTTVASLEQYLKSAPTDPKGKREALRAVLDGQDVKNAIIFCNRKRDVGTLQRSLQRHGYDASAIHGDLSQQERMATLAAFRKGEVMYLVASDVAARGLDIPDVSHIFNYDVPGHPEDYVHRVGRTGRAGRKGFAATLVTGGDKRAIQAIQKLVRKDIPWIGDAPSPGPGAQEDDGEPRSRRRRGGRGRKASGGGHEQRAERKPGAGKSARTGDRPKAAEDGQSPGKKKKKASQQGGKTPGEKSESDRAMGGHVPDFLKRPAKVED